MSSNNNLESESATEARADLDAKIDLNLDGYCHNGLLSTAQLIDDVCVCADGFVCISSAPSGHCVRGHVQQHNQEDLIVHGFKPHKCQSCSCQRFNDGKSIVDLALNMDVTDIDTNPVDMDAANVMDSNTYVDNRMNSPIINDPPSFVPDNAQPIVNAANPAAIVKTTNNVILTMAAGYPIWRHRRFVLSLRQSNYDGHVVIFLDHDNFVNSELNEFYKEHSIVTQDISTSECPDDFITKHPKLLRYYLYSQEAAKEMYADGLVLMIDFRDVVFQANPFENVMLRGEWIRFYEEVHPPTMKDSYYTYDWIRECWGDEVAQKMASAVIICSGATMATPAGVQHYTDEMLHAMKTAPREECMKVAHDQRFHNYLLYTGVFKHVRLLQAGHSEVYNMGYIGRHNRTLLGINPQRYRHIDDVMELNSNNEYVVYNEDGSIPAVLHQYDRFSALTNFIQSKYDNIEL